MSISSTHPAYANLKEEWTLMEDTYAGESVIKGKGQAYLPATPSQVLDGMKLTQPGLENYERYKHRAVFWDYVSDAVEALVGLLHQKPSTITVPPAMEYMLTSASREGETLQQLLRRINEHQLVTGRLGLLVDLPEDPQIVPQPYLALYGAQSIINWDDSENAENANKLKLVVLNESSNERVNDFEWQMVEKYRVLRVDEPSETSETGGTYTTALFRLSNGGSFDESLMRPPMIRGKTLKNIPFTFVNSKDIISQPDNPPLVGLARLCLAIYRGEADYRQSLFMQGQDTLVIIGQAFEATTAADGTEVTQRVGAGAKIEVNLGGDAKYIGVNSSGLEEQRMAIENDKIAASTKAGQLVSPQAGKQESGDALTTRISAQTATLQQIALTGAAGLEKVLKQCAEWMGLNPEDVKVVPNTEFIDHLLTSKDLSDLMDARDKGAPLSLQTIHGIMSSRGMTDKTFKEELDAIIAEKTMQGTMEPMAIIAKKSGSSMAGA